MNGAELAGAKGQDPPASMKKRVTVAGVEEWIAPVEEAQQKRDEKQSHRYTDGSASIER
jgi:hypothetical protein